MKVLLFGGAFSPPTLVHIMCAKFLSRKLKELEYDQLWILPCYKSISGKKLVDSEHRLNMCKIAFSDIPNTIVCSSEITNKLETDVVKKFFEMHTETSFGFAIGMDTAHYLFEFQSNSDLLNSPLEFIVMDRNDYSNELFREEINKYCIQQKRSVPKYIEHTGMFPAMSSSQFRKYMAEKDETSAKEIVSDWVWKYVKDNILYI